MSAWTAAQSVNTPRESSTHLLTSEPREPRSSSFYSILPAWHSTAQHGVARGVAWASQPGPGRAMPFSVVDLADPSCNHTPSQFPTARHLGSFPAGIGPSSRITAAASVLVSFRCPVRASVGGMGLLAVLLPVRPSHSHQDSSPMLLCLPPAGLSTSRCLAASLPRSQSSASASSLSLSPSPSLPAGQTSTSGRFSNSRTRWATRPPCPPIHSLSQPRPKPPIPRSALIQKASPTLDLLIGRITTPLASPSVNSPPSSDGLVPSLARASRRRVVGGGGQPAVHTPIHAIINSGSG